MAFPIAPAVLKGPYERIKVRRGDIVLFAMDQQSKEENCLPTGTYIATILGDLLIRNADRLVYYELDLTRHEPDVNERYNAKLVTPLDGTVSLETGETPPLLEINRAVTGIQVTPMEIGLAVVKTRSLEYLQMGLSV